MTWLRGLIRMVHPMDWHLAGVTVLRVGSALAAVLLALMILAVMVGAWQRRESWAGAPRAGRARPRRRRR